MTYEHALEWAEENISPDDYETWEEYLDAVDSEFRNGFSSFMPDSYVEQLHEFYDNAHIGETETDH